MIPALRTRFNAEFTNERYQLFLDTIRRRCGVPIEFPLSETPCFLPASLIGSLEQAAQAMIGELLGNSDYLRRAYAMVPEPFCMPHGEGFPTFIQVDFGLVRSNSGIEGRLVELQAFPSLYGFQFALAETARETWGFAADTSVFPGEL